MAPIKKDSIIAAVEAVHSALKDLQADERAKVLASVRALLDMGAGETGIPLPLTAKLPARMPASQPSQIGISRPLSLVELMQEKKPKTSAQTISLFAYYREKSEGVTRFGRDDLKAYFGVAKVKPPSNYDRDFVEAVKKGWIHEDGSESYLTSRGVEVVESGFTGERASSRPPKSVRRKQKANRKRAKGK